MAYKRHPSYKSWWHMLQRTTNPDCNVYRHYGGRGIGVVERWLTFAAFAEDMGEKPAGREWSLERVNNDLGYSPENCRWATQAEQMRNTRRTKKIDGVPFVDLSAALGGAGALVKNRIGRLGWTPERAATEPAHAKARVYVERAGIRDSMTGWARRCGMPQGMMSYWKIQFGPERAVDMALEKYHGV